MNRRAGKNYLRAHRKKSGLSQRDVGKLLGYKDPGQISRHERGMSLPPLKAALAYELIFGASIAAIFADTKDAIRPDVEAELKAMSARLANLGARGQHAQIIAHKLMWLNEREKAQAQN